MTVELIKQAMTMAKTAHDNKGQIGYFEGHVMRVYGLGMYYLKKLEDKYQASKYRILTDELLEAEVISKYSDYLITCILHDTLEDTDLTYDEIVEHFGTTVAKSVFFLSDGHGKNRKEKKLNTYFKIRMSDISTFSKLCDRVANVESSSSGSEKDRSYLNMYMKEYYAFKCALWDGPDGKYEIIWKDLDMLHGLTFK